MGCCGGANQKNLDIEKAKSRSDLVGAIKKAIQTNNDEIKDLTSHIKKNTELKSAHMKNFDKSDMIKRIPYLEELNTSYNELIRTLEQCTDVRLIF